MRILHVISSLDPTAGGPIAALTGLVEAQVRVGLEVAVAATYSVGQNLGRAEALRKLGARVEVVGPAVTPIGWHRNIRPVIGGLVEWSEVVHIHALWEEIQHRACREAMRLGRPYLIRPCGMLDPWSLAHSRWKKRIYMALRLRKNLKRAAAIHCTTEMERKMVGQLDLDTRCLVEPNGVRLEEFAELPAKGTFRARHPELADRPYIAYLGRIHPGKGLELLIPALGKMKGSRVMLVVIGPDSDGFEAKIRTLAAESGVTDRVIFTGLLQGADRVAALAEAELFCLPSFHENFGVAVVEALAAGLPVVISDHVYIHEQITRGRVGGVVPLDAAALAAELDRWLGDEILRREAAMRARPFVWEQYDWMKIAERWKTHYGELAKQRT